MTNEGTTLSRDEQEKELIERAEIIFDHQKQQYSLAIDGLRRLEDKAMKLFSALSIIITLAMLIVRNWWADIFPDQTGIMHYLCWFSLGLFIFLSLVSWGFTFSAMQPKEFERPSSDADELEDFFMSNPRYNSLSSYAREFSRLTSTVDENHVEKVKMIKNCSEAMLFGAWAFVSFIITFFLLKLGI
jgi:hypothetical protein